MSHAQMSWSDYGVEGKRFLLVDDEIVESYSFTPGGLVAAVHGRVKGPVTAPLDYWRIAGEELVISRMPDAPPYQALRLITGRENEISAQNKAGRIVQYKVSKLP